MGESGSTSDATTGDGEIVGGPRTMQQIAAQRRLQQNQAQVQEVDTNQLTYYINIFMSVALAVKSLMPLLPFLLSGL